MRDVLHRAMEHLTPRERAIIAMRFYEQMSQGEIARRRGISQMHVSRLQRAALEQLRKYVPQESASHVLLESRAPADPPDLFRRWDRDADPRGWLRAAAI